MKKEKKYRYSFRMNPNLNRRLKMVAHRLQVSQTAIIEQSLHKMLNLLENDGQYPA